MATTPFDRLMTTIRPHLPGAVDDAIRQELFGVCEQFFADSNAWQEELPFIVQANALTSEVTPYAGKIERLLGVTKDGRNVRGVFMKDMAAGVIQMPFPHGHTTGYVATVALTVTDPVTRDAYPIVPGEIAKRHTQALINGILSHMMAQPSKPYTNLNMALYYERKFKGDIARARNEANTGHTLGSQRWAFPQTFANR